MTIARDTEAMINARIAQIDHLFSLQLNEIMHHAEFQKLEGIVARPALPRSTSPRPGTTLKIKVLNVSKKDLLRDLQRAPEFDQSALFKKVYEEEFGVFGGAPFGALVGDYEFGKHRQDIELLEKISQVAAAAHAPFLTAAVARDVQPRELHASSTRRATWRRSSTRPSTRSGRRSAQTEDSRYVAPRRCRAS